MIIQSHHPSHKYRLKVTMVSTLTSVVLRTSVQRLRERKIGKERARLTRERKTGKRVKQSLFLRSHQGMCSVCVCVCVLISGEREREREREGDHLIVLIISVRMRRRLSIGSLDPVTVNQNLRPLWHKANNKRLPQGDLVNIQVRNCPFRQKRKPVKQKESKISK